MGRNGAGKSTLLRLLEGARRAHPRAHRARGRRGPAAPEPGRLPDPRARLARRRENPAWPRPGSAAGAMRTRATSPAGERQRLALEIVLGGGPVAAVLLDEPTRGMDRAHRDALAARIAELAGDGAAVMVATHDTEFTAAFADRVVLMGQGDVIADGTPPEVLGRRLVLLDRGRAHRSAARAGPSPPSRARGRSGGSWSDDLGARLDRPSWLWCSPPASPGTSAAPAGTNRGAGGRAGGAGRGRPAGLRRGPEREAHHRHRAVRGLRARARPGLRGGRDRPRSSRTSSSARDRGPRGRWPAGAGSGFGGRGLSPSLTATGDRARCQLAIACGLAGLAFGALLDVYQTTLAARQDLATYLAVSGTSLPVQLGPCDRQRRVLPPDRPGLHPRAAPLPAPLRGALGSRWPWPPPLILALAVAGTWTPATCAGRGLPGREGRRATSSACRTATAASAAAKGQRSNQLHHRAGPRSGWPPRGATRATSRAAAGRP